MELQELHCGFLISLVSRCSHFNSMSTILNLVHFRSILSPFLSIIHFSRFVLDLFYAESTSLAYSPVMPNGVAFVDDPPLRSVDDGLIDKLLRSMLDVDGLIDKLLRSTDDVELLLLIDKLFRRERRRHRSCNSLPSSSLAFKFSYMVQVS